MSGKIVGIDLGTTNSAVAHIEDGQPRIIPNSNGEDVTPSVVSYAENDTRIVGQPAKNREVQDPTMTVSSVKRIIGEDRELKMGPTRATPEEISATILQKIREDSSLYLKKPVDRAVVTVPAYFNDKQRNATKTAGEIAGLKVERIINEPTAAAIAYGTSSETIEDKTIMVYDLGGGTFDVSIMEISKGLYEILSTSGNNDLGGDDWTERIAQNIARRVQKNQDVNIKNGGISEARLIEECEIAKKKLSEDKSTKIDIPDVKTQDNENINVNYEITRDEFESLTEDLVDKTIGPVNQSLNDADLNEDDIDEVVLVGGSTRMPQIKNVISEKFEMEPLDEIDPEKAVALGASIQAGIIGDKTYEDSSISDIILLDVTPLSLGVKTRGGIFEPIIKRNTTIPTSVSKTFSTSKDNQREVRVPVYQGERDIAEHNVFLDEFKLRGIPPEPAGRPDIEVQFTINEDGILNVSAKEMSSGISQSVTIEGGVGMSDEKISEMRQEAEQFEEQDETMREIVETKNSIRAEIRDAKILIENYGVPEATEDEVREEVEKASEKLNEDDVKLEEIQNTLDELSIVVQEARIKAQN